jgi:hypothetical protein
LKTWISLLVGSLFLSSASSPGAQEASRKWGVGTFLSYNVPAFSLKDRFSATSKYGASWQYMLNPKLYIEMEYHRSSFLDGKLAKRTFLWTVDNKNYASPGASSEMKFNGVASNLLIFYPREPTFRANNFAYYLEVGGGFYNYKAEQRNFIFPGQTTRPLDPTVVLQPQIDQRTALSLNFGFGVQAFILNNMAIDLRARHNIVAGDLRPMQAWGVTEKTFPLQLLDVGAGLKFYFWK